MSFLFTIGDLIAIILLLLTVGGLWIRFETGLARVEERVASINVRFTDLKKDLNNSTIRRSTRRRKSTRKRG